MCLCPYAKGGSYFAVTIRLISENDTLYFMGTNTFVKAVY